MFKSDEFFSAVRVCEIIQYAGYQAVLAGGCVRDMLLSKPFVDIDIATDCPEDILTEILKFNSINTKSVGKAFGVVLARFNDFTFEIARFRKDINCDGRHPGEVHFCSMEDDAFRRDFTINAIFYDPVAVKYYDFVDGMKDIKTKKLRFVGNPAERIQEDYLRILRYIRFYAKGFKTTTKDRRFVDSYADTMMSTVSNERIRMELMDKIFPSLRDVKVFEKFPKTFNQIFMNIPRGLINTPQNPKWHPEGNVWVHTLKAVNILLGNKQKTPLLILATLLHDFGKMLTTKLDPESKNYRSLGHEKESANLARSWMTAFKFSNDEIDYVEWIVLNHMKLHYPGLKKSSLKRLIYDGDIFSLMLLTLCDCMGASGDITEYLNYEEKIKDILSEGTCSRPVPILTGHDLIRAGLKPGRYFGPILSKAYDRQLEDVTVTKEQLLKEALEEEDNRKALAQTSLPDEPD